MQPPVGVSIGINRRPAIGCLNAVFTAFSLEDASIGRLRLRADGLDVELRPDAVPAEFLTCAGEMISETAKRLC